MSTTSTSRCIYSPPTAPARANRTHPRTSATTRITVERQSGSRNTVSLIPPRSNAKNGAPNGRIVTTNACPAPISRADLTRTAKRAAPASTLLPTSSRALARAPMETEGCGTQAKNATTARTETPTAYLLLGPGAGTTPPTSRMPHRCRRARSRPRRRRRRRIAGRAQRTHTPSTRATAQRGVGNRSGSRRRRLRTMTPTPGAASRRPTSPKTRRAVCTAIGGRRRVRTARRRTPERPTTSSSTTNSRVDMRTQGGRRWEGLADRELVVEGHTTHRCQRRHRGAQKSIVTLHVLLSRLRYLFTS